jgi:hypothetical protein
MVALFLHSLFVGATGDMLTTIASAKGWDLTNATLRYANSTTAYPAPMP